MKRLKQLAHEHRYLLAHIVWWAIVVGLLIFLTSCAGMDYCLNCRAR